MKDKVKIVNDDIKILAFGDLNKIVKLSLQSL